MRVRNSCRVLSVGVLLAAPVAAIAQQRAESSPPDAGAGVSEASAVPDYGGDWPGRRYLSGDWGGTRSRLGESGFTAEIGWTQVAQGVVAGGRRRDWDYGGNLEALLSADFQRMGLSLGGTLSVRAETRYGETVNDDAGALTPVNTRGYFPLAGEINEGIPLAITELTYAHALGETIELTVGKMRTAEGDPVEFAGGLGRTQFLNSNFIYNIATSQTAPYSALGAVVDWSPTPRLTLSSAVFETTDSSTTTGFDHLNQGWTWWTQAASQYRLGTLPGGFNAGVQYAFGTEFNQIGGRLTLAPGGVAVESESNSWAVFCGAWQYLWAAERPPEDIDAGDDHADVRGAGLFARLGFGDPDTNPVEWSGSVGIGGRGVLPGRADDTFGIGYYYTRTQAPRAFAALGLKSSGQGFEAFYNLAITPAVGLTLDVQWLDEGATGHDPATVPGMRLHMEF